MLVNSTTVSQPQFCAFDSGPGATKVVSSLPVAAC